MILIADSSYPLAAVPTDGAGAGGSRLRVCYADWVSSNVSTSDCM